MIRSLIVVVFVMLSLTTPRVASAAPEPPTVGSATWNAEFADAKADVNGVTLHYVVGGHGSPLVLVHGWLTTWYEWHHVMPQLAGTHTLIVPDIRGMGDSSKPVDGYDKKTAAEDVYQLARSLGFSRFDLVGHDIGGMIAYSLAAHHPNAVRKLVIVDAAQPGVPPWDELVHAQRSWHFAFNAVADLPEMLYRGHERDFLAWFFNSQAYRPNVLSDVDLDVYSRAFSAPGGIRGGVNYYRAFAQDVIDNSQLQKTKLTMPVLGVAGAKSGLATRLAGNLQYIATNYRVQLIPNSGHWIPDEQPAALAAVIKSFLRP